MALFHNDTEITSVFFGSKVIEAIYKGDELVWQAVRSCFGAGYWIDEKPWLNQEGWKTIKETGGEDVDSYLRINKKVISLPLDGSEVPIEVYSNTTWKISIKDEEIVEPYLKVNKKVISLPMDCSVVPIDVESNTEWEIV